MNLTFHNYEAAKFLYKYIWYDDLLTKDELKKIIKFCNKLDLVDATVGDVNEAPSEEIRKSKIAFVNYNDDTNWLFQKLKFIAETVNNNYYRFNLTGFDYFQYTEYQGNNSHYDFHTDIFYDAASPNADLDQYYQNRKLSISLLLNDPKEFKGGEFQFTDSFDEEHIETAEQKVGRVIAFPSFIPHRVAPIKTGVRKSLVYWVTGPKFQ
jgi:PKHD-type hydroxylase